MGLEILPPGGEVLRPQKNVAHLGHAAGAGALKHGLTVLIKFLAVQMGVAVHAFGRQRHCKGINAFNGFLGHVYLAPIHSNADGQGQAAAHAAPVPRRP